MIRKIEAFSRRYPMSSVLVSTRSAGYEQASFGKAFSRFRLGDFNEEQIKAYVNAWFQPVARGPEIAAAFLRDLDAVPDLRGNPLMLSLLCTLYKARGHIPRNRRAVYRACAELLFHRWDSMRQIDQPFDHVHHGEDLMQEIALFFFKSETAQAGVEEGQLREIIAQFLRDSAGVLVESPIVV